VCLLYHGLLVVHYMLSPVICLSSVTFVRPTQVTEIFGFFLRHLVP